MPSKKSSKSSSSSSKNIIPVATFPNDLPHVNEQIMLSIVVGQTNLHWAVHEGYNTECRASLFWKTTLTTLRELKTSYACPTDAFSHHIPSHYRYFFFGGTTKHPMPSTKENAWLCSWKRQVPTIHVYIATLGVVVDEGLVYIFSDLPARLYHLSPSHFWPDPCCVATGNLALEHNLHGIELQRRANLRGAVAHFGHPALVLDGGTFNGIWSYTATNVDGKLLGGGYCAKMAFSWLTLRQSTDALPLLQYADLIDKFPQLAAPIAELPTDGGGTTTTNVQSTASASASEAEVAPAKITCFSKSTEDAILEDALLTLTIRCRYVINHWLKNIAKPASVEEAKAAANVETGHSDQAATAGVTAEKVENDQEVSESATVLPEVTQGVGGEPPAAMSGKGDQQGPVSSSGTEPMSSNADASVHESTTAAARIRLAEDLAREEDESAIWKSNTLQKNDQRCVILTGAEKEFMARLLQPDHGGVMDVDPTINMPVVNRDFAIHAEKHLFFYAIGRVIYEEQLRLEQLALKYAVEEIRKELVGLRVAVEFAKPQYPDGDLWYRGSVLEVDRGAKDGRDWKENLSDDLYWVRFDDGDDEELNPYELYCALIKYHELGERDFDMSIATEEIEVQRKEKKRDSKMYAERLCVQSPFVQRALAKAKAKADKSGKDKESKRLATLQRQAGREEQEEEGDDEKMLAAAEEKEATEAKEHEEVEQEEDEAADAADISTPSGKSKSPRGKKTPTSGTDRKSKSGKSRGKKATATPSSSSSSRKRVKEEVSTPRAKKVKESDAASEAYVGRRVAKVFPNGKIYFGDVSEFSPAEADDPDDEDFWWIKYEDGDEEQFDARDMEAGFRLYAKQKHLDTMRSQK